MMPAISWPTAAVMIAAMGALVLLVALDHAQAGAVIGLLGTVAGSALPQLVRKAAP